MVRGLLRANFQGDEIEIGPARADEVIRLETDLRGSATRDVIDLWTFVAIRFPPPRVPEVHALGWRVQLQNTWITSALVSVSIQSRRIGTASGHDYSLGTRDGPGLRVELWEHLIYSLQTWGFRDIQQAMK